MMKNKEIITEAHKYIERNKIDKNIYQVEKAFIDGAKFAFAVKNNVALPVVMPRYLIANSTPTIEGKECLTAGNAYKILNEFDRWVCVIDDHNRMEVMVNSFFNGA